MTLKKIISSNICNAWFSSGVLLLSSLVAIPIVVSNLPVEEITVWFLFAAIVSASQGILFGFNSTFMRFVSYSYSGVRLDNFRVIKSKTVEDYAHTYCKNELSIILSVMKVVYLFLAFLFFLLLVIVGSFVLSKSISHIPDPINAWVSWAVIVVSSTLYLLLGYYQVFLEGLNEVALVHRIIASVNLVGMLLILMVLLYCPTLLTVVCVYQFIVVLTSLSIAFFSRKKLVALGLNLSFSRFDKNVFILVWESAWKSGSTNILAIIVRHSSSVFVAQYFPPIQAGSYLFTKRLFDVLERFTMVSFQSRLPNIASLRGRGDLVRLLPFLKQTQYLAYAVFLLGYFVLLFFGEKIILLINSNVEIGAFPLLCLFSFATLMSRWGSMSLSLSTQSNHVVEHLSAIVYFVVFFVSLFLTYNIYGVNAFPLSQLIAMIFNIPVIMKTVYGTISTSFFEYEKSTLFPAVLILSLLNIAYCFIV